MDAELEGVLHDIEDNLWLESFDHSYEEVKHDLEGVKKAREETDDLFIQWYLTFVADVLDTILQCKETGNVSSE